jgi:hypothetical protein
LVLPERAYSAGDLSVDIRDALPLNDPPRVHPLED